MPKGRCEERILYVTDYNKGLAEKYSKRLTSVRQDIRKRVSCLKKIEESIGKVATIMKEFKDKKVGTPFVFEEESMLKSFLDLSKKGYEYNFEGDEHPDENYEHFLFLRFARQVRTIGEDAENIYNDLLIGRSMESTTLPDAEEEDEFPSFNQYMTWSESAGEKPKLNVSAEFAQDLDGEGDGDETDEYFA